MKEIGRLITAMVTPFDEQGQVDYEQAKRLAKAMLESGSDGVILSGTTGESPTLSTEEKLRLFAEVKGAVGDRGAIIAGTGNYNTAESIELSKEAEREGVDGLLLVVPYYNKPPPGRSLPALQVYSREGQPALHRLQRDQPHQPEHDPRDYHSVERDREHRGG